MRGGCDDSPVTRAALAPCPGPQAASLSLRAAARLGWAAAAGARIRRRWVTVAAHRGIMMLKLLRNLMMIMMSVGRGHGGPGARSGPAPARAVTQPDSEARV